LRCYLSSTDHDKLICCNPEGVIYSTGNRQGWEKWHIIEDSNGMIKLQNCAHGKYLYSAAYGHVSASNEQPSQEQGRWIIRKSPSNESYFISSNTNDDDGGEKYLTCQGNGDVCATAKRNRDQEWRIEILTGELCFISSSEQNRRLSCHPWRGLSMSCNWKGWEVRRFIEAGNGHVRISNWTHDNKVLCSDEHGKVWTTDNLRGYWEKWEVVLAPDGYDGVVIKSVAHGSFLQVGSKGVPITCVGFAGPSTTWHLDAGNSRSFFLSSVRHDKRIGSSKDGVFSSSNRKDWEVWEIKQLQNGVVCLISRAHGKNLGSDSKGHLYVSAQLRDSEMWKLEQASDGGCVHLVSKEHHRLVSCDDGGNLSTRSGTPSASEAWSLEPRMPPTITGESMRNLAIGGSVAVASIVAAPFAIMGIVGSLGFAAGGVASGSFAAGMMSAEAIASGGVIAAGGTVATLQSIGAAGLGLAGTTAAMGAGAVVGASAIGISAAASGGRTSMGESTAATNSGGNRPFCDWRSW